jgi:hypothetical protein
MTITLPLPHQKLSPNARVHWARKSVITRRHRALAWAATREALGCGLPRFRGYSLAFYYVDARRRDDDNAEASCKAYRDGIAQALGIDDHELPKVVLSTFTIDRENPRLEITLHP